MYHSLSDGRFPDQKYAKYTSTRRLFSDHLQALLEDGFLIGNIADLWQREQKNEILPEKYCVLTFDDGHKSSLEMADAMRDAGVSGTFFLTKDYCQDRDDFLKDDEIRVLSSSGFDFGTHGVTHRALSHMPLEQMRAELRESKLWLENILGKPVRSMSLPAGQGNSNVFRAACETGYAFVGNSEEKLNKLLPSPRQINRFCILANHSSETVKRIARGSSSYIWKRKFRAALLSLPKRVARSYDITRS
jgi:peptidoglycan/xylan/chitin deacetylase (PgdA/CDA1 family)